MLFFDPRRDDTAIFRRSRLILEDLAARSGVWMRKRRKELRLLFRGRYGLILPDNKAGRRAARCMAQHFGKERQRARNWLELNAPWLSDRARERLFLKPEKWTADRIGKYLGITDALRQRYRLTTIAACDKTPTERRALAKVRKKEGDRLRAAVKRLASGRIPRAQYEAESLSKTKPWEAAGISRRTWYRRQNGTGTSVSLPCLLSSLRHTCATARAEALPRGSRAAEARCGRAKAEAPRSRLRAGQVEADRGQTSDSLGAVRAWAAPVSVGLPWLATEACP